MTYPDLSRHPFLGMQPQSATTPARFRITRVVFAQAPDGPRRHGILQNRLTAPDTVTDLEDAEDRVLTRILADRPAAFFHPGRQKYRGRVTATGAFEESMTSLDILINRGANLIAARTQRGAATTVLMHPDAVADLDGGFIPSIRPPVPQGRWTKVGMLGSLAVHTGPMPRDSVVVLYKGHDEDALAYYSDDRSQGFAWTPEGPQYLGGPMDFAHLIGYDRSTT